jgi:hypothetical protein
VPVWDPVNGAERHTLHGHTRGVPSCRISSGYWARAPITVTPCPRHDLAGTWAKAGDRGRAAAGFADLLPECSRALGPDNPLTLRVRHALARSRGEMGDQAKASSVNAPT